MKRNRYKTARINVSQDCQGKKNQVKQPEQGNLVVLH
jgi:hypothetical protein